MSELNEIKIEISEKSDRLMKKSITYLEIGFWVIAVVCSIPLIFKLMIMILTFSSFNANMVGEITALILGGGICVFLLIKMYAYIGDYKVFRKTKTQKALEDLLDAQKGYYWWIFVLPWILLCLALIAFIFGNLLF